MTSPFPLPPSYAASFERLANTSLRLDWRKLAKKKPPMWPGSLYLYASSTAAEENERLTGYRDERHRGEHYFIGSNAAGIVFALDRKGRIVIFDEIESGDPDNGICIAPSFDALLASVEKEGS